MSLKALYAECHYAECHYAKCHCAECHYAECHYAECHYAESHGANMLTLFYSRPLWAHAWGLDMLPMIWICTGRGGCTIKLFTIVINIVLQLSEVIVTVSHFNPSLIFTGKVGAYLIGVPCRAQCSKTFFVRELRIFVIS